MFYDFKFFISYELGNILLLGQVIKKNLSTIPQNLKFSTNYGKM